MDGASAEGDRKAKALGRLKLGASRFSNPIIHFSMERFKKKA